MSSVWYECRDPEKDMTAVHLTVAHTRALDELSESLSFATDGTRKLWEGYTPKEVEYYVQLARRCWASIFGLLVPSERRVVFVPEQYVSVLTFGLYFPTFASNEHKVIFGNLRTLYVPRHGYGLAYMSHVSTRTFETFPTRLEYTTEAWWLS